MMMVIMMRSEMMIMIMMRSEMMMVIVMRIEMMMVIVMRIEMMMVIMMRRSERVVCDRTSHSSCHTCSSSSAVGYRRLQPVSRCNDVWLEPAVRTQAWINEWMDGSIDGWIN